MRLLLGAFPPELGPYVEAPPPGWRMASTGIGALLAAAATARLVEELRPERVLFVGTCGHYDDRLRVGDHLFAAEALSSSLAECRGEAYRPALERTRWPATWELPLPGHGVVVPPAITRTTEGAGLLGRLGAAEHLELTGVYAACHAVEVPVGAALAVVNAVGPEAQAQWRANHAQGSLDLLRHLRDLGVLPA
ncbi:MAG: phosphorylase [Holophagaceae bacterium]